LVLGHLPTTDGLNAVYPSGRLALGSRTPPSLRTAAVYRPRFHSFPELRPWPSHPPWFRFHPTSSPHSFASVTPSTPHLVLYQLGSPPTIPLHNPSHRRNPSTAPNNGGPRPSTPAWPSPCTLLPPLATNVAFASNPNHSPPPGCSPSHTMASRIPSPLHTTAPSSVGGLVSPFTSGTPFTPAPCVVAPWIPLATTSLVANQTTSLNATMASVMH
jgi:hypothetical protein